MLNVLDTLEASPCLSTHLEVSIPSVVKGLEDRVVHCILRVHTCREGRKKPKARGKHMGLYDRTMKFFSLLDFSSFGKNIEIV